MRNELSHTAGKHTIGIICGSYRIALYTVLQSAIDGEILPLPVRVRHVENSRTCFHVYILLCGEYFTASTFVDVACVFHSHSRLQR